MATRLERVVKNPPEGLYLFRFELAGPGRRCICLTTNKQGQGLYQIRPAKKNEPPTDAWRALCFAAKNKDMLEHSPVNADLITPTADFNLAAATTPEQAAPLLWEHLKALEWDMAPLDGAKITYLDNVPRVRNKKAPARS
jgi:hypothetical protein